MILDNMADKIVVHLSQNLTYEEIEKAKMKLGIMVLLHDICMISSILLLAAYLSVFKESALFLFTFGIFRMMSGGIHLKSSIGCLLGTGCLIFGGVKIGETVTLNLLQTIIIFLILFAITYCLAPQGTENNKSLLLFYNM